MSTPELTPEQKYAILEECWAIEEEAERTLVRVKKVMRTVLRTIELPAEIKKIMDKFTKGQRSMASIRGATQYLIQMQKGEQTIYVTVTATECVGAMDTMKAEHPELDPKKNPEVFFKMCAPLGQWT